MEYFVGPANNIQEVIDTAHLGDTLTFASGVYHQRLTVSTPGLTLQAGGSVTLHGGEPITALWSAAPEVGLGVYKASLPYTPAAITTQGKHLWKINHDTMHGLEVYGCLADGFAYLRQPPDGVYTGNIGETVNSYWDGIGALFGVKDGTTYIRFRNTEHPAEQDLYGCPETATLTLNMHDTVVKGFTILGGHVQVCIDGELAYNNVIENCIFSTGQRRVEIRDDAHSNIIRSCSVYSDSYGFDPSTDFVPGEWDRSSSDVPYPLMVRAHIYNENKFCVGRTTEDDCGVYLHDCFNTTIENCRILEGVVGIHCEGGSGHLIRNNYIQRMAGQGVWLIDGCSMATLVGNDFEDNEHHIRLQSLQSTRQRTYYIGNNTFWQPRPTSQSGKHIYTSFEGVDGQAVDSPAVIWVYNNSFAGGGWSVDAGKVSGSTNHQLPKLRVVNNLMSSYGIASSGGNAKGIFAYNWVYRNPGYGDIEEGNIWGDGTRMWSDDLPPEFMIPDTSYGQTAVGVALDVGVPFILDGVNYDALPGVVSPVTDCGVVTIGESMPPSESFDKQVSALVQDIPPGSYTVTVVLQDAEGRSITENTSDLFTIAPVTVQIPSITKPMVTDVESEV